MKRMMKGMLALAAAIGLAGSAQALGTTYYAKCIVNAVPSDLNGVYVTKTLPTSRIDDSKLKTTDNSSNNGWVLSGSSYTINFYAFRRQSDKQVEFLYWTKTADGSGDQLSEASSAVYHDLFHQITAKSKSESSPTTETLYAHFHVHDKQYVANGLTIDHKCVNTATTCKGSCGSSAATLVAADSKIQDGQPFTATVEGDQSATLAYFQGETELTSAPTEAGDYTVKMTYGDKTVSKNFTILAHVHDFNCTVGNGKLTVKCKNSGCTIPDGTSLTLLCDGSESLSSKSYNGQAYVGTVRDDTPSPATFASYTGGTYTDVTWDDSSANVGDHTASFKVTVGGQEYTVSKTYPIYQRDIADATMALSATSLPYTGADQTVTISSVKIGDLDVTYTEDGDSVRTAKAVGDYTVKITANGNFTGSLTKGWSITNYSGQPKSVEAAQSGVGTVSGTTLTVTDSTKLEYDAANQVWYAGLTLTWDQEAHDWEGLNYGYAIFTKPSVAQMTVGETTFTGAQSGSYEGGKVDNATDALSYWKNIGKQHTCTYLATTTWRVKLTPEIIEAAKSAGAVTGTMYAGALPFSESDDTQRSPGVEFKTYTVTVPINENLKLYDEVGNQVYPDAGYKAQIAESKIKYLTLDAALKAASAGQTVNALAACEQAAFSIGANVTLNLGGFGAAGATYAFVDVTDLNMGAKVVSDKAETVSTSVAGFDVQKAAESYTYTLYRSHIHAWEFTLNGTTLTATCTNTATQCDLPGRMTSVELTVTGGSDGVAPTFAIANADNFLASVNKFAAIASIGSINTVRLTDDGASKDKWYVGDYRSTCEVTIEGEGVKTLVKEFSITKPDGGYAKSGWIAGSRDVRYDSWDESLAAAADGDTVYYKGDDRNYKTHEFSIGAKNLTLDFGGKTLTYTSGTEDMTLKNAGTGTLTFQNVTIQQPKYAYISHQISAVGNIQFGTGVRTTNQADNPDRYLKITASEGTLTVTNGQYECSFAGSYKLRGGQYKSTYGEPTADTAAGYIVRTVSGDYDRDIVYHEHHAAYSAEGNVISATCDAQDHEFCGFGTKTATLNAPNKEEDGQPYSLAQIVYGDGFPEQTGVITYWNGDEEISAPTTFGSYVAKTTIGGATAVKAFEIIHHHNFAYDKDDTAGTITARCTTTEDCDFNVNKRIATLTAQNGTYTGFGQDLASTATNTSDFPTNVVLTYSVGGDVLGAPPSAVGDYTATMTVADTVTVTKEFSIAKASMGNVAASMTAATLNFTGAEQQNTLGSATLGSYNLQSGDYELSGVTKAMGSGYSNETYQVTLTAKGDNFSGSKTIEWTIQAPTRTFADNAMGRGDFDVSSSTLYNDNYGDAVGRTLAVSDSTKIIFYNGHWFVGMTVDLPYSINVTSPSKSALTTDENLRVSVSTVPGRVFTGSEIYAGTVKDTVFQVVGDGLLAENDHGSMSWAGSGTYAFFRKLRWFTEVTPAMIEQAKLDGQENLTFTMTVGGLTGKWEGIKYTDFTITAPVDGFTFAVRAGESADLGEQALDAAKVRLGAGASVTTTAAQTEGQIYTAEAGYQVYVSESAGTYTYSCGLATVEFTVAAPANASVTQVATNGVALVSPYTVLKGTVVTVSYKANEGYLFANGKDTMDAEITVNQGGEQSAPQGTETTAGQAKIGTTYYLTLADALKATTAGKTCELLCDVNLAGVTWTPISGFAGTFDGKGYTISGLTVQGEGEVGFFKSINGGTVTNLTISGASVTATGNKSGILAAVAGPCTITGVKILNSTISSSGEYVGALYGHGYAAASDCEIAGCTISGSEQVGGAFGYMWVGSIVNCTVTGNTITATSRAGGLVGKVQFAGENIGVSPSDKMWINGNTVGGTVDGGDMAGGIAGQIMGDDPRYEIKDNTIDVVLTGTAKNPIGILRADQNAAFTGSLAAKVTGNWWEDQTLAANSYQYTNVAAGVDPQTIYRGVAQIGETAYKTLNGAAAAATDGDTVKLLVDITTTGWVRFNENYNVTLDLNGKTISSASDECLVMGLATATQLGTGTLTITGEGSIIQTADREDCDVVWARHGNVVISNGYFEVNGTYQCVYSTNRSQVDIYGGTFKNLTGGDVLNVNNAGETTDIQCFGGSFSHDPALGDDAMGGTFVASGYASYKDGELWTVSAAMPKATVAENPIAAAFGGLDAAYTFTKNGVCPAQPVASKNVDYVVTFDNDVEAGAIRLAALMENGWTNFPAMKFTAGTQYPLIASMQKTVSVAEMYLMGSFTCGISNVSVKTETKMTVQLVMNDTVPYVITNVTYTLTAKGPIIVPPIGGDPKETPEIKPVEEGVYEVEVKTNTTTVVEISGLKETDEVIVPPQINTIHGTESNPIDKDQVIVKADATNSTGTVSVDITDAFTITTSGNSVTIELNPEAEVTVKIAGKDDETVKVTPELGTSAGTAVKDQPLAVSEESVSVGVKTIPGLKYRLLSGDTVSEVKTLVKEIVAKDTRVVLEAAKGEDPSKFYKVEVVK